jgi:hypothetical protein
MIPPRIAERRRQTGITPRFLAPTVQRALVSEFHEPVITIRSGWKARRSRAADCRRPGSTHVEAIEILKKQDAIVLDRFCRYYSHFRMESSR